MYLTLDSPFLVHVFVCARPKSEDIKRWRRTWGTVHYLNIVKVILFFFILVAKHQSAQIAHHVQNLPKNWIQATPQKKIEQRFLLSIFLSLSRYSFAQCKQYVAKSLFNHGPQPQVSSFLFFLHWTLYRNVKWKPIKAINSRVRLRSLTILIQFVLKAET